MLSCSDRQNSSALYLLKRIVDECLLKTRNVHCQGALIDSRSTWLELRLKCRDSSNRHHAIILQILRKAPRASWLKESVTRSDVLPNVLAVSYETSDKNGLECSETHDVTRPFLSSRGRKNGETLGALGRRAPNCISHLNN